MSSFSKGAVKKQLKALPQNKKFDILVYADYNCATGFGNVMTELINSWKAKIKGNKNISITIFSLNDFSTEVYKIAQNVSVVPANIAPYAADNDPFQRLAFLSMVQQMDFNLIYLLQDVEMLVDLSKDLVLINSEKKKLKRLKYKMIAYFPIDSLSHEQHLAFLDRFDEVVTYTQYAKGVMMQMAPESVIKKLSVIPHGVDQKTFCKLPESEVLPIKEKLFGKDKFVIGTVNRNSARKDLSTLILAFVKLKEDFTNVERIGDQLVLYLHCNPLDPFGVNLRSLASRLGLKEGEDIFFPKDFSENKGVSPKELNQLYNCMDVFVTTSTAEGWGLTVTEAMSAETLVIAPEHTALAELILNKELTKETGVKHHNAITTDFFYLEPSVFVYDGDKVRYKTKVSDLKVALHWVINSDNHIQDFSQLITNAKLSLNQYKWQETADKFWALIEKYKP